MNPKSVEFLKDFQNWRRGLGRYGDDTEYIPPPISHDVGQAIDWAIEQIERMQWRPIETAPQDCYVLLLCPNRGTVRGRWIDDKYANTPRPYWTNDLEHVFGKLETRDDQPKAWMPLPPPPGETK